MNTSIDLQGKIYLVTGASSGIGRMTSIYLSQHGATIALIARRKEMMKETLLQMEGAKHSIYYCDLSDLGTIEPLIQQIISEKGPLSGIVYCAGIAPSRPLAMMRKKDFELAMTINCYSYIEMVRCLSKKGNYLLGSSCIAISSISSLIGYKSKIAYCSSKAALDAATRCMAKELAQKGIRINTIQPAWVDTFLYQRFQENWSENMATSEMVEKQLLGITSPEEIAAMAAYLLSDNARTITGSAFRIDSGYLA